MGNQGFVILQNVIMDLESDPITLGSNRVCIVDGKPVKAKIIDFGSELKCHEVLSNLTQAKLKKLDDLKPQCPNLIKSILKFLNCQVYRNIK